MTPPVYTQGEPVDLLISVPERAGVTIVPSSISVSLTDQTGALIAGPTDVSPSLITGDVLSITVPSSQNQLPTGTPHGLRQAVTSFTTSDGVYTDTQTYILKSSAPLIRMVNSFILEPETYVTRFEMPPMPAWDQAQDDDRIAALTSAYRNMVQLRYRYPIGIASQSRIIDFGGLSIDDVYGRLYAVIADMAFFHELDYNGWPDSFQQALKRAQMAEANVLLQGDPVGDKRRQGIETETVGESSMTFRKIPDVSLAVSKEALIYLRGFLDNRVMLTRA
jgi:hypothetical protein